jgi:hypothetical protein
MMPFLFGGAHQVRGKKCRKTGYLKATISWLPVFTFSNDAMGDVEPYGDRRFSYFKSQIRKMNIMRIVRQETRLK